MLLDINLRPVPGKSSRYTNGREVARVITKSKDIPYIYVTSLIESYDIQQGLDSGADDYIAKPYDIGELLARVRLIFRKREIEKQRINESVKRISQQRSVVSVGELEINFDSHEVKKSGSDIHLSGYCYKLLSYFAHNRGKLLSNNDILINVWGDPENYSDTQISSNIKRLKSKIGSEYIKNNRGSGYIFDEPKNDV